MSTTIPIAKILEIANPLKDWIWNCAGVLEKDFQALVAAAPLQALPVKPDAPQIEHLGRIRYLIENDWSDPIDIDVGVPSLGYAGPAWPVTDGNHRLAAAALRGDVSIQVDIEGQIDHAAELFGMSSSAIRGKKKARALRP